MIHVIDSIMGSGKTTWAVNYIVTHPEYRYIYVAPFLKSCQDMIEACPQLNFFEPVFEPTKSDSFKKAIAEGRNICTTHELIKKIAMSETDVENIGRFNYVLILDEVVEVFDQICKARKQLDRAIVSEQVSYNEDTFECEWKSAETSDILAEIMNAAKAHNLIKTGSAYFYRMPMTFLRSFNTVFILTFMFESSHLAHQMKISHMQYEKYHIICDETGNRDICHGEQDLTESKARIKSLLTIYEGRNNDPYEAGHALSATWYKQKASIEDLHKLMARTKSVLKYPERIPSENVMYATYALKPKKFRYTSLPIHNDYLFIEGYKKNCNITFNCRGLNDFRHKTHLAYLVNTFEHPGLCQYFKKMGSPLDNDQISLSTMIQWIWRSAIRDGNPVWLYLPSARMRKLLTDWLNS